MHKPSVSLQIGALILAFTFCFASLANATGLQNTVVVWSHFNLSPGDEADWITQMKRSLQPKLEELKASGALVDWNVYVRGIHSPTRKWTHVLVLEWRDENGLRLFHRDLEKILTDMGSLGRTEDPRGAVRDNHFDTILYGLNLTEQPPPETRVGKIGEVFQLRLGESVRFLDPPLILTLQQIVDSRCPGPPIRCTWAGEIGVTLALSSAEMEEQIVYLGTVTGRRKQVGTLIVELVAPFATSSKGPVALKITLARLPSKQGR